MRITISHNRSKGEIIESVDRSFKEMIKGRFRVRAFRILVT